MRNISTKLIPSLVWIYTILFTIIWCIVVLMIIQNPIPKSEAFFIHNIKRLELFTGQLNPKTVSIAILGDSRSRYALVPDEILSEQISTRTRKDVRVLSLNNNWAVYSDFEDFLPNLVRSNLNVIVIQEELFAKERASPANFLQWRSYLIWLLFGTGEWNPGDVDQHLLQKERRCSVLRENETIEERKQRIKLWMRFEPQGPNATKLTERRKSLIGNGLKVPILRIPVSSAARSELPGFRFKHDTPIMAYPGVIKDNDYCDTVHMNPTGRQIYSKWFVDQIATVLLEVQP